MKNLPLVIALLPDKLQTTYTKVFEVLKAKLSELPISVTCDYEVVVINSIEEVFPDADIFGYFIHFKKSLWRHIQLEGLVVEYCDLSNGNNQVRLNCKLVACLAFLPPDDVIGAFVMLKKQTLAELNKFYRYFEDNYIGARGKGKSLVRKEPRFPINLWNCYSRTKSGLPRTTNNLEGWHNALQSSIRTHPHLLSLIDSLKLEQSNTENLFIQLSCGRRIVNDSKKFCFDKIKKNYEIIFFGIFEIFKIILARIKAIYETPRLIVYHRPSFYNDKYEEL
ncbi:hypothetical protein BpHYR1_009221 [Brachionus plicatilis]|uniref:MULE transposase domain-containing protein n=1 Tax=Brachionus plicatilis TaxID=10195 RepID=A0A3M7Q6Z1_BRAPC|nr:hypothetical protein BpHYR1_009221 [Brachionus plicatilis]